MPRHTSSFVPRRVRRRRWLSLVSIAELLLVFWPALAPRQIAAADARRQQPAAGAEARLSQVLNADGTINLKRASNGSFDANGYHLATAANGQPRFLPAGATQAATGGNWDDFFGFPGAGSSIGGIVYAIAVDGANVYVGGSFSRAGQVANTNGIARWDGHRWSTLGGGVTNSAGLSGTVNSIAVANGIVYAGGTFARAGNAVANGIAQWNTTTASWSAVGTGIGAQNSAGSTPVVKAIVHVGNELYIGGNFTGVDDVPANRIARWDGAHWSTVGGGVGILYINTFSTLLGEVDALAADGSGGFYVGGYFDHASTQLTAKSIAHWTGTAWEALGDGITSNSGTVPTVYTLAVDASRVIAGGEFTTAGSVSAPRIAVWNRGTSIWSGLGTGIGGSMLRAPVNAIIVQGGLVYAGGSFASAGGVPATNLAVWHGQQWQAVPGGPSGNVTNNAVNALGAGPAGGIFVAGLFDVAGNLAANNIAVYHAVAGWRTLGQGLAWAANILGTVNAVAVTSDGMVFAAGLFNTAGGVATPNIARWDGRSWSTIGAADQMIRAFAVDGTDLYVGGSFSTVGNVSASHVARWDDRAGVWSALGSGTDGNVYTLAVSGGVVYAGGVFTHAGGTPATYVAQWDGVSWSALGQTFRIYADIYEGVYALATYGPLVVIGGHFDSLEPLFGPHITYPVNDVVTWNSATDDWLRMGPTNAWGVAGGGTTVYALTTLGSDLYVGGDFATAGGIASRSVARWSMSTQAWSGLGGGVGGSTPVVKALAAVATDLYATGTFTAAGGRDAQYIAKWDTLGGGWSALGTGLINDVDPTTGTAANALTTSGASVYVGGQFNAADGHPAASIARYGGAVTAAIVANQGGVLATADGVEADVPANAMPFDVLLNFMFEQVPVAPLPLATAQTRIAALQAAGAKQAVVRTGRLSATTSDEQPIARALQPYTMRIAYTDQQLQAAGVSADSLNVMVFDGTQWLSLLCNGCVDKANHVVTVSTDIVGEFALVGTVTWHTVYLPLVER